MQKTAFEESPDGFLEEFSRVTTGERHSRQKEQHMRSQGGRRVLAGCESSQEVADLVGVARNGTDEAVELAF